MDRSDRDRLPDDLEAAVRDEAQEVVDERLSEAIVDEQGDRWTLDDMLDFGLSRRQALQALGLVAIGYSGTRAGLAVLSGTASANPEGQVGTSSDPLKDVITASVQADTETLTSEVVRVFPADGSATSFRDEQIADHSGDLLQTLQDISTNNAVDDISAVQLPPGTHSVDPSTYTTVTWDLGADIVGCGRRNTIIQPTSSWTGWLIDLQRASVSVANFEIAGQAYGEHGIRATSQATTLRDLRIQEVGGVGINVESGAYLSEVERCRVLRCQQNGVAPTNGIAAGANILANRTSVRDSDFNATKAPSGSSGRGIQVDGADSVVLSGIELENNQGAGLVVDLCQGVAMESIRGEANNQSGTLEPARDRSHVVIGPANNVVGLDWSSGWFLNGTAGNSRQHVTLGDGGSVSGSVAGITFQDTTGSSIDMRSWSDPTADGLWIGPCDYYDGSTGLHRYRVAGYLDDGAVPQVPVRGSTPAAPQAEPYGGIQLYMSDGTTDVAGADGDLVVQVTDSAGTTKEFVLADFSAN